MKTNTNEFRALPDTHDADEALEKADAQELYHLYRQKVIECDRVGQALETIAKHYAGSSDAPRYAPSENAVGAMERVALAAIELAKAVSAKDPSRER